MGPHRLSIFSTSLSAAAFVAYFLGAIVPLAALAFVTQRYVLEQLRDRTESIGLVALILCIGGLSLAAFLVLRRLTAQALLRMRRDNDSLELILEAAQALAVAPHREEAARCIADCAQRVATANACYLVSVERKVGSGTAVAEELPPGADEPVSSELVLIGAAGDVAAFEKNRAPLQAAIATVLESGNPLIQSASEACPDGDLLCLPVSLGKDPSALLVVGGISERAGPLGTLAALGSVALRTSQLQDVQRNFFVQVTDLLVTAMDQQFGYHEGHARRVAQIANRIGRKLDLDEEQLERLHFAALLHDIGMIRIPGDRHTDRSAVRAHPGLAHRMLSSIRLWEDLAPIVLYHHEWYDGQGYPEGRAGSEIPLESRIIGLAEAVDSMTSSCSYKRALTAEEMLAEVRRSSGTQFDPDVVKVFLDLVEEQALEF